MSDRRPPHSRCPAVPGPPCLCPGDPEGARLLRSCPLHHLPCLLPVLPTASDLSERHVFGKRLPAVVQQLRLGTHAGPPGARARSRRLHRGAASGPAAVRCHCVYCGCVYCGTPSRRPLNLRATRSGGQHRRHPATAPAPKLHHRTVQLPALPYRVYCCSRQFISAGPCCPLGYERKHNHAIAQCLLPPSQIFALRGARQSGTGGAGQPATGAPGFARRGRRRTSRRPRSGAGPGSTTSPPGAPSGPKTRHSGSPASERGRPRPGGWRLAVPLFALPKRRPARASTVGAAVEGWRDGRGRLSGPPGSLRRSRCAFTWGMRRARRSQIGLDSK